MRGRSPDSVLLRGWEWHSWPLPRSLVVVSSGSALKPAACPAASRPVVPSGSPVGLVGAEGIGWNRGNRPISVSSVFKGLLPAGTSPDLH